MELVFVALAALLAGFIDAIVGGGGLVSLPALFTAYPQAPAATVLGTNKGMAVWGTAWAAGQFARRVSLPWRRLALAMAVALAASGLGAWAVTHVSSALLRQALPWVLGVLLIYTLANKHLGRTHAPRWAPRQETAWLALIAALVGFYDGFFGPGTGSLFVFAMVRLLGWDFLHASAGAKLLNSATNIAALALFTSQGHVWWQVAAVLAVANVVGSLLGTRLALARGAGFVRIVFLLVVSALIARSAWQAIHFHP